MPYVNKKTIINKQNFLAESARLVAFSDRKTKEIKNDIDAVN